MKIYVLFHETNTGHSDDSDGYVEAVYANEADAEAAKLAAVRAAIAAGVDVYWDPDTETENPHWDHDWRVERHAVREGVCLCDIWLGNASAGIDCPRHQAAGKRGGGG